MDNWNSTQYLKFESERTRPAHDLAFSLTVPAPRKVLDVGCGPGNSTQVLRQRFPGAEIRTAGKRTDRRISFQGFACFQSEKPVSAGPHAGQSRRQPAVLAVL